MEWLKVEWLDNLVNWVDAHWRKLMWAFAAGFLLATGLIGCMS